MAKSKKQPATEAPTAQPTDEAKPAAKKAAAKADAPAAAKPAKKAAKAAAKKQQPAAGGSPIVDTGLAAATAARMLAHRAATGAPAASAETSAGRESSSFQKLKNNLTNPAAGLSNILGGETGQKKSHNAFGPNQQVNRGQNSGGGANRLGVPRRTSG